MDNNMYQGDGPGYQPTAPQNTNRNGAHRGRRGRVIAGVTAAAVLAGGAAFGAVTILSSGPAAAAAGPSGQAAVLNSALTSAATPATTASTAAGTRHRRAALARLRLVGGLDGQFTFETKTGPRTLAFERGTIESVASGEVVVRATDGTTWSWKLVSDSVVRENGKKTTESALSAGGLVFVGGPVVSGTHDARLIVIRTPHKASSSGTSSSGTSSSGATSSSSGTSVS